MSFKNSLLLMALILTTVISCKQAPQSKHAKTQNTQHNMAHAMTPAKTTPQNKAPQIGDIVPSNLVCMVNNQYMGRKQLEVKYEGKTYYGCCKMCQKRIPADPKVRVAIDPYSKEKVNKAEAVIAITGPRGMVSYFENKANYKKYMAKQKG